MIVLMIDDDDDFRTMAEDWVAEINTVDEDHPQISLVASETPTNFFSSIHNHKEEERRKIALIDLSLKGKKSAGLGVLRRIRESEEQRVRLMPAIIYSASDDDRDVKSSYEKLANSFVWKGNGVDQRKIFTDLLQFWRDTALTVENLVST